GRAFLEKAYKILVDMEKAKEYTRKIYKGEHGQLTIGFTGAALSDLIPIIQSYQKKYTETEIYMHQMSTHEQLIALPKKEIDVRLLISPIKKSQLFDLPNSKQKFVVALPETHQIAKSSSPINIQELENDTFIIIPRKFSPVYY